MKLSPSGILENRKGKRLAVAALPIVIFFFHSLHQIQQFETLTKQLAECRGILLSTN